MNPRYNKKAITGTPEATMIKLQFRILLMEKMQMLMIKFDKLITSCRTEYLFRHIYTVDINSIINPVK